MDFIVKIKSNGLFEINTKPYSVDQQIPHWMKKSQYYQRTIFSPEILKQVVNKFEEENRKLDPSIVSNKQKIDLLSLIFPYSMWEYDTLNEFLAEYNESIGFQLSYRMNSNELWVYSPNKCEYTHVSAKFQSRESIEAIFQIFDFNREKGMIIVEQDPIKIFIGHGRDGQWLQVKNHLQDQFGFEIVTYELGPRAGLSVKQVLESMLNESSFAILVLTGEDIKNDGELLARPNVIHELGLFQGKLGFRRAIILLEDGVEEFSNILGVNQLRFTRGTISGTFGDILATIRREFGKI